MEISPSAPDACWAQLVGVFKTSYDVRLHGKGPRGLMSLVIGFRVQ